MSLTGRGMSKTIHSPEHRALCALLVATREAAGLTQQEVGRRLKRPQSFVAKYEGGERRIDVIEFIAVAQALNADALTILKQLLRGKEAGARAGGGQTSRRGG